MEKTAIIVTGGHVCEPLLLKHLSDFPDALVIAVDGALEVLHGLSVEPDFIVGDFDTVNQELLGFYQENKILRHSPEKDQTDTELAVETARQAGCRKLDFFGALGSRADHSLGNIFLLQELLQRGLDGVIYDECNKLYLKDKSFSIRKQEQFGNFVSLLPLTDKVYNVTLDGFKYCVSGIDFYRERTLGISNEIQEEKASVQFSDGVFLVVESKDGVK